MAARGARSDFGGCCHLTAGTLPASEDVEDVEQNDHDDGNPEQPGDDAFHDDLLLREGTSHRGGVWFLPVRPGL